MIISKALKKSLDVGGGIRRKSSVFNTIIKAKGGQDLLTIECLNNEKPSAYGWEPKADDLVADDWYVVTG